MTSALRSLALICRSIFRASPLATARLVERRCAAASRSSSRGVGGDPISRSAISTRGRHSSSSHTRRSSAATGQRKRKITASDRRGSFVDLKTIAAALLSRSFTLASLAEFLQTPTRKADSGGHGKQLTEEYLRYAVQDVQATFECFQSLRDRYALHAIEETPIGKILSEASLGKAYLKQMGVRPLAKFQPDFPPKLIGKIMSAYFGGRAEIRWRREIRQVLYCDFLSMYPTVCTLMGLWRFVIAQGTSWADTTEATRAIVNSISLEDLQRPGFWRQLTTIVRVRSEADIFPVRAKYDGKSQTIGLNYLTSKFPLWFTLADVIAAKTLGGKSPEILEAITFAPNEPQSGLKAISIAGNSNYRVNAATDDFFKRLIDLRTATKARLKKSTALNREALKSDQQALKILANSTSYGIFIEIIVGGLDDPQKLTCYGPSGEGFPVDTKKIEEPGRYFHPLLATLITGAAQLMLGIAERLCTERAMDWAFCDTDSLAIAKPDDMAQSEFFERAQSICNWFTALNPYEKQGSIFKIEDANYPIAGNGGNPQFEPLYCYCISAKRYVLFNRGNAGEIIIRKASAHGLGQFLPPYDADDAPQSIPSPSVKLSEIGVERWHYDLWFKIVETALAGHSDQIAPYHDRLNRPATSRYGATTPALLKWFKQFNCGREYGDQVKPFNFLSAFTRPRIRIARGTAMRDAQTRATAKAPGCKANCRV